jgi:hypothetical protein
VRLTSTAHRRIALALLAPLFGKDKRIQAPPFDQLANEASNLIRSPAGNP